MRIGTVGHIYIRAINSGFKYINSVGGTRSGKTYEALQLIHLKALNIPNLVIIVAGLTASITKKNLITPYKEIAGSTYFNEDTFGKQEGVLTYPNGSLVYFMSHGEHNSGDKFTGIKCNYALLDEINISPEGAEVVKQLGMRLENGSIILTMNPTRRLKWVDKLEANPKTVYVHSTYKDNLESLPKSLVEDLEYQGSVDKRFKAVYLEGRYMADSDLAIFTAFEVVNTFPTNPKWVSWGQDYGFTNDPTTLVETCFYDGALWIRAHLYEQGMSTEAIREANKVATSLIIGDSSEPRLIEELGRNVMGIKKYPGHKKDAVRAMLQHPIKLYYDSPDLIREFEDYQWKKQRGIILDELNDGNDHLLDAVFYAVRDKLRVNTGKYSFR